MNLTITSLTNYQIGDLIHESERTVVYRGVAKADSQPVVIKLMRNEFPSFNELVQFRNQYTIASNLLLEGIVKPLTIKRYQNGYALIMPDFGGISLAEYYQNLSPQTKDISQFLDIGIKIAEIIYQLHQNRIIHKDIKPANILINPETKQVKIIDFSISSLLPKETQTIQNYSVLEGTLAYISPEQTGRMNRGIDYRSDFYSLGVTFFEMLNGVLPFETTDPMELVHCHMTKTPPTPDSQLPTPIINIVVKLMAKNAEDRYKSALGLKYDLEQCLRQWQEKRKIEYFELGSKDISDRFSIPEKLYGRVAEVQQLLAAFVRVASVEEKQVAEGKSELMLVAGFSGIGKTVVVNEVHKPIVRQRGYFIKGKFDQFNRNIPFSALVQSLRDLMGQIESESDAQLKQWKNKILTAVGVQGQVIIDVIPELEKIIGKQPAAVELSGSAAQNRFNLLFGKFIQVFTTKEHPLVIFLDDLQWADSASLNLMKLLMSEGSNSYLLMIGAYRDHEVFPAHPLMLTLDEMRKAEATINTITLAPLSVDNINCLVADTLSCDGEVAKPLTELVYQKTKGNPFFTTQFLLGLYEDELIKFNSDVGYWECDIAEVRQRALTDDVVEFMAQRLQKLPLDTQEVLKLAACMGNQFDLQTLAIVSEKSEGDTATALWKALQEGFILPQSEIYKFYIGKELSGNQERSSQPVNYKFLHDRVQQAAYSLIRDEQKQTTHYHIGQLLLQKISPEAREERIFELLNQLNYGTDLITEQKEKDELAVLNLIACRKARSSTAYQAGREYANIGILLLGEDAWQKQYIISLAFHEIMAELASLCGDFETMEQLIETVIEQAHTLLDQVNVYRIRILSNVSQNQFTEAIAITKQLLEKLGVTFPEALTDQYMQQAVAEIEQQLGERTIEDLVHLPIMTNKNKIAIVEIANSILPAAYLSGSPLFPILILLAVKLSIQYGNTMASCHVYVCYGVLACNILKDVDTGVKFGELALQVVLKLNAKEVKPDVLSVAGLFILHRKYHIKETLPRLQEGYIAALEVGKLEFVGYTAYKFCLNSFWCGCFLGTLEHEISSYYNSLVQFNQLTTANYCRIYWQSTLNLLGYVESPTILSGEALQEEEILPQLLEASDSAGLHFFYVHKLMLCYLFSEIELAQQLAVEARKYLVAAPGMVVEPAFYFYDSLTALSALSSSSADTSEILQQVEQNQKQLQEQWANYAPMNHQHKYDLVEAEKYRVLGKNYEARDLYDRAIDRAQENEYIQEEALANELAAKFYLEWGKEKYATLHMQEAYYCYARWGAKAKTDDLEKHYPHLLTPIIEKPKLSSLCSATLTSLTQGTISPTATGAGEILDLATLMKASRTLSKDISLDGAVANLMQVVKENAGAETVALMLFTEQELMLRAIVTDQETHTCEPVSVATTHAVPLSIINQVKRNQNPLVIDNASNNNVYAGDAYIQKHQPQSVLCLPLIDRGKLIGILYLENNQLAGAFTNERVEVLNLLCSQAAISLENARLYGESQNYAQQLEQIQLQLVQSEKMASIGQLVSGVAHEINNPVGFISGNLDYASQYIQDLMDLFQLYQQEFEHKNQTIQKKIEEIELDYLLTDLPELIESMKQGTERITEISKSMGTFSRADTIAKVPFKLHEGIDSTLLILRHRLKANEIRPEIEVVKNYGNLPEVNCYPGQLNQVFMNLIANAIDAIAESNVGKTFAEIKASPNQITITTEIEDEKQEVIIRIGDNGMGMSESVKEKIFGHLFTTKGVGKGTGLGLSISRQIVVEKHGGKITCTSELGRGTEFVISLPNN